MMINWIASVENNYIVMEKSDREVKCRGRIFLHVHMMDVQKCTTEMLKDIRRLLLLQ